MDTHAALDRRPRRACCRSARSSCWPATSATASSRRSSSGTTLAPLLRCLWAHLSQLDYKFLLVFDPVEGLRPYPNEPAAVELATKLFDLKLADGVMPMSLENLVGVMRKVAGQREARCALVVDFASRLTRQPDHLDADEHRFFVAAERISLTAHPIVPEGRRHRDAPTARRASIRCCGSSTAARTCRRGSRSTPTRVAVLTLGLPDYETRARGGARTSATSSPATRKARRTRTRKFARDFAQMTDGLPLVALADIAQLADRQGIGFRDVDDAVQCYKVGVTENPWKKDYLRERIADALPFIEERVRGQRPAVTKTIDILMRSVMGLTGAQARASGNRPRGVLFFAGPTGVGKTELAKTLTQLIFGDERAYIRFDMSEFAEEHTGARLLGAPPGYIGYDAGGELTNAVREKPFSVVLFDEIEKAHPRILDKFLQILEDGRLTDGRGETAYFSEAILVFTSQPRHLRRGRARPARAERVARRPARGGRVARAHRDPGLLQVPAVAPGDPQPHRRQHHRVRLHHAGDRRADLRRHAAQRRQPRARRAQGRPRARRRRCASSCASCARRT